MNDGPVASHDEIIELLPDYAVGALDDGDLWRVAAHLDTCATCLRAFSDLLVTITLLAEAPRPRAEVRSAVLARVGGTAGIVSRTVAAPLQAEAEGEPARSTRSVVPEFASARPVDAPANIRRFPLAALALAAAVLLLVAGYAVWSQVQGGEESDADLVAALLLDPDAAHAINDSELDVGAGGAMFVDDGSDVAYLVASGLPIPGPGEEYRVWLFTEDGRRVSAGAVPVDPDGVGQAVVRAPGDFAAYWAVGVSLEPVGESDAPTTPLVVGGWLR